MDQERFDQLTRTLASGQSRRGVLKALTGAVLGGAVAAVGVGEAAAKPEVPCKAPNTKCGKGKNAQCCTSSEVCDNGTCTTPPPPTPLCGNVDCQQQLGDNDCTTTECIVVEIFGVPTPRCYNDIYELHGQPCQQGGPGICSAGVCIHSAG